jgi:hypothetical protein
MYTSAFDDDWTEVTEEVQGLYTSMASEANQPLLVQTCVRIPMMGRSLIALLLRLVRVLGGTLHNVKYVSSEDATATHATSSDSIMQCSSVGAADQVTRHIGGHTTCNAPVYRTWMHRHSIGTLQM